MGLWVLLVLSQATSHAALVEACRRFDPAAAATASPVNAWLVETRNIVDWQRADYASSMLAENGLKDDECPRFLAAAKPARVTAQRDPIEVTWAVGSEGLCFSEVTVKAAGVTSVLTLDGEHCADGEPRVVSEDFDFDGKPDVRLVTRLHFAQSRRFDVVLLQRAENRYEFSAALTALDDLKVDKARRQLDSRVLDENQISQRAHWRWRKGQLERAGTAK